MRFVIIAALIALFLNVVKSDVGVLPLTSLSVSSPTGGNTGGGNFKTTGLIPPFSGGFVADNLVYAVEYYDSGFQSGVTAALATSISFAIANSPANYNIYAASCNSLAFPDYTAYQTNGNQIPSYCLQTSNNAYFGSPASSKATQSGGSNVLTTSAQQLEITYGSSVFDGLCGTASNHANCPANTTPYDGTHTPSIKVTSIPTSGIYVEIIVEDTAQHFVNIYLVLLFYTSAPATTLYTLGVNANNVYTIGTDGTGADLVQTPYQVAHATNTFADFLYLSASARPAQSVLHPGGSQSAITGYEYPIDLFFSVASFVSDVFIQECPGNPCSNTFDENFLGCPVDQNEVPAAPLTDHGNGQGLTACQTLAQGNPSECTSTLLGSIVSGDSALTSTTSGQYGHYIFPAITLQGDGTVGYNCIRFLTSGNSGTSTISVNIFIKNCGEMTTCSACVSSIDGFTYPLNIENGVNKYYYCGWCLSGTNHGQPDFTQGSCQFTDGIVDTTAFSDSSCIYRTNLATASSSNQAFITTPTNGVCFITLKGDPRIYGLQGQDFQVHGTPNEYFNLVTASDLQVNSRFIYLDDAKCDNFTECFSHPGTYIDEIGIMMGEDKVRLVASGIESPMRVFVNGKELFASSKKVAAGDLTVRFVSGRRASIRTPKITLSVSQSDHFFNVETNLLATALLDEGSKFVQESSNRASTPNSVMHGLIGQTWRNTIYAGNREYEGEVPDYQVADGLWGSDFNFNLYNKN